jgi:Uma2 family endonuclease
MTVEEYLQLDRESAEARYEYIDGQVRMLAGGTADHAVISANLVSILHQRLRGSGCVVYTSDIRVALSEKRYTYPDISVSCDCQDRGKIGMIHSPSLVIEVLSTTTEDYDRGKKFVLYRQCPSIQEYMLVSSDEQQVEVYRRETKDLWSLGLFRTGNEVKLAKLGVLFPVNEVYENVTFAEQEND